MNELRTTLDMGKETYIALKCKQNDDRTLILTLLSNGVTWIPEVDSILELRGKRADNTVTIQTTTDITIVDNIVTITLGRDFTRVPGNVDLELNIRGVEAELTTFTFELMVVASVLYSGLDIVDMTPPSVISDLVATKGTNSIKLTWVNPPELDLAGVKIVRQTGNYPTDINDGIVVFRGLTPTYVDNDVVKGTTYYYRAFPYDTNMNYNNSTINQQVSATLFDYVIYGVKIDTTNSNPSTSITYTDDAVGFTNATNANNVFNYGSWADKFPFNLIKPCKVEVGLGVTYYIRPDNYTLRPDGKYSYNTNESNGDTMVEFPKVYWKFETVGTDLYIRISNAKVDDKYECLAHLRGNTEKDNCYISAYLGCFYMNKMMSLSGKPVYVGKTISQYRDLAKAKGYGYDILGYSQLLMLQILFVILFKSTDSQAALGRGYVDGNTSNINTGFTDAKGLFYGEGTGKSQMKFCGLEDFWGNVYTWIDGLHIDSSRNIYIGNIEFNDAGSGYVNYGQASVESLTAGFISSVQGTTHTGFLPKTTTGSSTTAYCDTARLAPNGRPIHGGYYGTGSQGGAFTLFITGEAANVLFGCRLMFL